MAVNLDPPRAEDLLTISGVRLGIARAGIRKPHRKDLLLIALDEESCVAGVFTRNRFRAAPVIVCSEHLGGERAIRAIVVNTGVANAGTGEAGVDDARSTCAAVARLLDIAPTQVLPLSTGVIMEPLPVARIEAGLPECVADLAAGNWASAAEAIMTTDTVPKATSRQVVIDGRTVTVTGIAKGAGMIQPNMATMLAVIATDAAVGEDTLGDLTRRIAERSFNAITVDGDTSTNDALLLAASGRAGNPAIVGEGTAEFGKLFEAVLEVAQFLAQAIVRDGEGRHQVHHHHRGRGRDARGMHAGGQVDRPFAAREDRLLRLRPEPGAHPRGRRQRRHRRPRRRARGPAAGRRYGGRERRACAQLHRGAGAARDASPPRSRCA